MKKQNKSNKVKENHKKNERKSFWKGWYVILSPLLLPMGLGIKNIYDSTVLYDSNIKACEDSFETKKEEWKRKEEGFNQELIILNKKNEDMKLEIDKNKKIMLVQRDLSEKLSRENNTLLQSELTKMYVERSKHLSEAKLEQVACTKKNDAQKMTGIIWSGNQCEVAAYEEARAIVLKEQIDQYNDAYIKRAEDILRILEDQKRDFKQ